MLSDIFLDFPLVLLWITPADVPRPQVHAQHLSAAEPHPLQSLGRPFISRDSCGWTGPLRPAYLRHVPWQRKEWQDSRRLDALGRRPPQESTEEGQEQDERPGPKGGQEPEEIHMENEEATKKKKSNRATGLHAGRHAGQGSWSRRRGR